MSIDATLPDQGMPSEEALRRLEGYKTRDVPWREGRSFAYVFDAAHEALDAGKRAYLAFLSENALDPTSFPSLLALENEVVGMCAHHVQGGRDVVGNFTSGGTESIMLAMKAARDWARKHRPDVTRPEIALPITAHAAFHKAADYLGLEVRTFPVDLETCRAGAEAARRAITERTIVLVGSAPSYAFGVVDDIEGLAALAQAHGLWMHVDACMGGVLLPFLEQLGETVPRFDFRVPGVWSLSMDLHKYGYCPKGASVVLYRDKGLRRFQIYACAEWGGYTIVNPTVQSSRSGGPLAAAWATMMCMGQAGYLELAREMLRATQRLVEGIDDIEGLSVAPKPDMTLLAITSNEIDVFHLPDRMKARGWYVQPTLGTAGLRPNVHLSVTGANVPHVDAFLADLRAAVEEIRALPEDHTSKGLAAMAAGIDADRLDAEGFARLMALAGMAEAGVPESTTLINQILQELPAPLRKAILIHFVNELFE